MIRSNDLYRILKERGFNLPEHCTYLSITLPGPDLPVEIEAVMNDTDSNGKLIIENNDLKKIEKRYGLYEIGKPLKCGCCERFFKKEEER
jgi:hypothetical protein